MTYLSELPKRPKRQNYSGLKYAYVGIQTIIPIILGLTIGVACDNLFGVHPIGIVVFLFFGASVSFYQIYKLAQEQNATRQHKSRNPISPGSSTHH